MEDEVHIARARWHASGETSTPAQHHEEIEMMLGEAEGHIGIVGADIVRRVQDDLPTAAEEIECSLRVVLVVSILEIGERDPSELEIIETLGVVIDIATASGLANGIEDDVLRCGVVSAQVLRNFFEEQGRWSALNIPAMEGMRLGEHLWEQIAAGRRTLYVAHCRIHRYQRRRPGQRRLGRVEVQEVAERGGPGVLGRQTRKTW